MTTPITELTLPADPHVLGSRWGSAAERPEGQRHALGAYTRPTRDAVRRILETRTRVEALMWAARAAVIREQLRVIRGSAW